MTSTFLPDQPGGTAAEREVIYPERQRRGYEGWGGTVTVTLM